MIDALRNGNKDLIAYLLKHGAPVTPGVEAELRVLRDDSLDNLVATRARAARIMDLTAASSQAQTDLLQEVVPDLVDLAPVTEDVRTERAG
jgi:hypothetical protein